MWIICAELVCAHLRNSFRVPTLIPDSRLHHLLTNSFKMSETWSTWPASISVWNFLALTPDVVNIEAPLPYLKQIEGGGLINCDKCWAKDEKIYLFLFTIWIASSRFSACIWKTASASITACTKNRIVKGNKFSKPSSREEQDQKSPPV
jgi:hypothetical protein